MINEDESKFRVEARVAELVSESQEVGGFWVELDS